MRRWSQLAWGVSARLPSYAAWVLWVAVAIAVAFFMAASSSQDRHRAVLRHPFQRRGHLSASNLTNRLTRWHPSHGFRPTSTSRSLSSPIWTGGGHDLTGCHFPKGSGGGLGSTTVQLAIKGKVAGNRPIGVHFSWQPINHAAVENLPSFPLATRAGSTIGARRLRPRQGPSLQA